MRYPATRTHLISAALGALFLLTPIASPASPKWNPDKVMGASECGECHEDEVSVWKKTRHQKNFKALSRNKDAKAIAKKMGVKRIKHADSSCAQCHYTVGNKNGKKKIIAGVSCESCHAPGKDWINVHNDYGGKGINKKQESASHRKQRYHKLERLGMIRPDNIYGWARNCLSCHIVANEKLVNTGGHKAGSDFKLSKRSQGKIRHYDKASADKLRFLNLVSDAVELELSLRALADASGGKYASAMQQRASSALARLKNANAGAAGTQVKRIVQLATNARLKAGNQALKKLADNIAVQARRMVQAYNGYPYSASKLKAAPVPKARARKPAAKAKPAPRKKVTPKADSKPKPKPVASPKTTPVAAPAVGTDTTALPPSSNSSPAAPKKTGADNKQSTTDGTLIERFELIAPQNPALCNTLTPWMLGEVTLDEASLLPPEGCFSIRLQASRTAQLHLFAETSQGRLLRLLPNACGALSMSFNAISAGRLSTLPVSSDGSAGVIRLQDLPGVQKIYLVLTDSNDAGKAMSELGERIQSICQQQGDGIMASGFVSMLELVKKQAAGSMDWQLRSFRR